jgi:tetratricopeptide (TPR) repeat protein
MLQHLGRHDEALAQLENVARLTPDDPEIYIAMANGYRDTGRKAEAVAAYRRFLEVDKSDDPMRPIAERFIEILSQEN